MPTGYHPCFRRGARDASDVVHLQFDSDSNIYHYTGVPLESWQVFLEVASQGTDFNEHYRALWTTYTRGGLWPSGLANELPGV